MHRILEAIHVHFRSLKARNAFWLVSLTFVSTVSMADSRLRQFASELLQLESQQVIQQRVFTYADLQHGDALKKLLDPSRIDVVMGEYFQATLVAQRDVPEIHKLMEPIHKRLEKAFAVDPRTYEAEHLDSLTWVVEFLLRSQVANKRVMNMPLATPSVTESSTTSLALPSQQQTNELLNSLSGLVNSINNFVASSIRDKVNKGKFTGENVPRAWALASRISDSTPAPVLRLRELVSGQKVYQAQCMTCHVAGVANSPRLGDFVAWRPLLSKGLLALTNSTLRGKGAMGAQSGGDWDDVEIARAVVYMANAAGAKFEEPKPPSGHPGFVLAKVPTTTQQVATKPVSYADMDAAQRLRHGERLYAMNCAVCHQRDGRQVGPIKAIAGSPALQSSWTFIQLLLNGQNKNAMPSWKHLSNEEIASIVNFTREKFGNIGQHQIQPDDVSRHR